MVAFHDQERGRGHGSKKMAKSYITSLRPRGFFFIRRSFYNFGRTAPWMDCCLFCQLFSSPIESVIGVCLCALGKGPMVGFLPSAGNSLGTSFTSLFHHYKHSQWWGAITESVSSKQQQGLVVLTITTMVIMAFTAFFNNMTCTPG